ncbi:MAG: glycosyltransferase family 9 protein [candidate division Zixibacteria bacterium]|nr:glycosyltransferase family 9 protein [candidate division Zixibacteria bacterium]
MQTILEKKSPRLARVTKEFEVQFKWLVVWIIFFLLRRGAPARKPSLNPHQVKTVLILRYDKVGDMIISLPTFHTLKERYPHLRIDVLASRENRMIIEHDSAIHQIYLFRKDRIRQTWQTLLALRRQRYDVTIDLVANVSVTSLIMVQVAGGNGYKIGVRKNNLTGLYDFNIPRKPMARTHASKVHAAALIPFGITPDQCPAYSPIRLAPQQWERGRQLIAELCEERYSGLIGINISAGKPNRAWGEEKYTELVRGLAADYADRQFLIMAAPVDYHQAQRIAAGGDNVRVIQSGLSLLDVISMVKHLDCIMSPDTSICHIAANLGVPLLGLYSQAEGNFARWRPLSERSWVLRSPEWDSLQAITVRQYRDKIDEVLAEIYQPTPARVVSKDK